MGACLLIFCFQGHGGIEPTHKGLQTHALPLGYMAVFAENKHFMLELSCSLNITQLFT